jgi:hypothetical protein
VLAAAGSGQAPSFKLKVALMKAEILSEDEAIPAKFPPAPLDVIGSIEGWTKKGLGEIARRNVSNDAIWMRLEAWIAWRWTPRDVTWVVEGPGVWEPRLKPAVIWTTELWHDGAWVAATLEPAPLGYVLSEGTWRITAVVGDADADPPPEVFEAFARLREYFISIFELQSGVTQVESQSGGADYATRDSVSRPANFAARAMQNSGAADMLRRWRK